MREKERARPRSISTSRGPSALWLEGIQLTPLGMQTSIPHNFCQNDNSKLPLAFLLYG